MPFLPAARRAEALPPPSETSAQALPESEIDAIAGAIERAGMSGVASLLLQAFKPLSWVGGQVMWALEPLASGVVGRRAGVLTGLAGLLEQDSGVEALIARLDPTAEKHR